MHSAGDEAGAARGGKEGGRERERERENGGSQRVSEAGRDDPLSPSVSK